MMTPEVAASHSPMGEFVAHQVIFASFAEREGDCCTASTILVAVLITKWK